MQYGSGTFQQKAATKVVSLLEEMPLGDLAKRLNTLNVFNVRVYETVFKRAEKDKKEAVSAELLAWVAQRAYYMPVGMKAAEQFIQSHVNHLAIDRVCSALARARDSQKASELLRQVIEKAKSDTAHRAATLSLAQALVKRTNELGDNMEECEKTAAEAEHYFEKAIGILGKNPEMQEPIKAELAQFRKLRVGKTAPEITAPDLDKKEFNLTDYRGKVVLLDFWGHW
jgi:hypothetical protein